MDLPSELKSIVIAPTKLLHVEHMAAAYAKTLPPLTLIMFLSCSSELSIDTVYNTPSLTTIQEKGVPIEPRICKRFDKRE